VAPRYAGAAAVREVVLLPLNVVIAMPSEVEPGADRVAAELLAYLKRQGKSVRSLSLVDARVAWLRSAEAVLAHPEAHPKGFEGAAQVLARNLREGGAYDALIVPAIVMRPAKLAVRHAGLLLADVGLGGRHLHELCRSRTETRTRAR